MTSTLAEFLSGTNDNISFAEGLAIMADEKSQLPAAVVVDSGDPAKSAHRGPPLPLWVRLLYTAFVCVLVPRYWIAYGPTNFLYFCDTALLVTLVGMWRADPLLVSMPAVGILLPQALWMVDFLSTAIGFPLTGMTDYMFDQQLSLFTRGLSFFHFWLPILLVWLVYRLGYDRRAFLGLDIAGVGPCVDLLFLHTGPTRAVKSTQSAGQHQLRIRFQQRAPANVAAPADLFSVDADPASGGHLLAHTSTVEKIFPSARASRPEGR